MAKRKTTAKAKKPAARKTKAAGKSPKPAARPAGARALMGMGGAGTTTSDLELSVCSITLDPDPPVHDQAFTVSFSVSPSSASTSTEVFVNGVAQVSSSSRVPRFTPGQVGNPSAGDEGKVVVTATAAGFSESAVGVRRFTFA